MNLHDCNGFAKLPSLFDLVHPISPRILHEVLSQSKLRGIRKQIHNNLLLKQAKKKKHGQPRTYVWATAVLADAPELEAAVQSSAPVAQPARPTRTARDVCVCTCVLHPDTCLFHEILLAISVENLLLENFVLSD